ncbi:MAG: membrane protein insertion efficiency factor YidD [Halomonas sp.]|uniref:membrane protein insertion efficiency factor YidD n=1 Tax=Halomonas sp. TaxID=1486246 RepID=UPI0028702CB4|nr:membrane protein insertion efficiency factor YidD [Halomonas sp.]MDR9440561.1 membrane protein insertion efficiency factor YidD [Halomonas sp.]
MACLAAGIHRLLRLLDRALGWLMVGMVRLYQLTLSPLLGPRCRYWPSCSNYTVEALQVHGPLRGGILAVRRITRCHPGCEGGIDPVPDGPSEQLCREDPELDAQFRCRAPDDR